MIRKALPFFAATPFFPAATFIAVALLASVIGSASAQTSAPPTKLDKQLDKIDLSISAAGLFNNKVTGSVVPFSNNQGQSITEFGSNTVGVLASIHYPAKPYFGLEFNYGYGRYTENFQGPGVQNFLPTNSPLFQVQTKVNEYSFGYLVTPPHPIFGLHPFASAGVGTQAFKPTAFGGQEEPEKARMTYYYSLGLQKDYSQHFGFRVGFRQIFFLAPDFGQNYLTILKHASTYEPTIGFYLRY